MSDPLHDDRGNRDRSITNPAGQGSPLPGYHGTARPAPGGPFLIGEAMTGGYGRGADILHSCTIAVERGEIAVIVGPNGAGKSTAMKAIFGLLKVRGGSITVDGTDITGWEPNRIVEAGARAAEHRIACIAVADHAVERVDRFVGCEPGQPEDRVPEDGGDDAVGEVLGQRFDRRAGDAGRIQAFGIPPNDVSDREPSCFEPLVEPIRDRADMAIEATQRDQGAGEHCLDRPAAGDVSESPCDGPAEQQGENDRRQCRHETEREPGRVRRRRAVESPFNCADQPAEGGDRMRHKTIDHRRVTDRGIDRERQQQYDQGVDGVRGLGVPRGKHVQNMKTAAGCVNPAQSRRGGR